MRQNFTDYKLELKISECMLVSIEFLILIYNSEFWFWIWKFKVVWAPEASYQSKYWKYCMVYLNAIFCACKISKSFADHPSNILISKVDKIYIGLSMIIQKNRRLRTSNQNLIHFAIRWHRDKHLSTQSNFADSKNNIKNICWAAFYYTLSSKKWRTLTKFITIVAATNR